MKKLLKVLSYVLVAAVVYAGTTAYYFFGREPQAEARYPKLEQLQNLIEERFIGEADATAMEDGAAAGMVAALGDEWSYYISAADYASYLEQVQNAYVGVGITITPMEDGYLEIIKVEKGGPAEEAGIKPGDVMIRAAGEDCAELGLEGTRDLVKGEEGTFVELTIRREEQEFCLSVERRYIEVAVAEYEMLEDNIAYIQITEFDQVTIDQFTEALAVCKGSDMEGLILDLRSNPGGSLNAVCEIARKILPKGLIVYTEDKYGAKEELTCDGNNEIQVPMVVLVNDYSASASEILAGAIQDYGKGILMGTQTYGKGIVQRVIALSDGSAVKLTISHYYTPNGRNIHEVGIEPDVIVEFDGEAYYNDGFDNQLEEAVTYMKEQLGKAEE